MACASWPRNCENLLLSPDSLVKVCLKNRAGREGGDLGSFKCNGKPVKQSPGLVNIHI